MPGLEEEVFSVIPREGNWYMVCLGSCTPWLLLSVVAGTQPNCASKEYGKRTRGTLSSWGIYPKGF